MKRLAILIVVALLVILAQSANSPKVELINNETLKITFTENGTVSADTLSSVAKTSMPQVRVVSSLLSANCSKDIYQYTETIYSPEYYIFAPNLSGKDCLCPSSDMYRKTDWKFYMFGYLYEPTKAYSVNTGWVEYDKCLATNCYTSGMMPMGEIRFAHPNQEWAASYDAEIVVYLDDERNELHFDEDTLEQKVGNLTVQFNPKLECDAGDVVIYNNEVKHYEKYAAFAWDMEQAKTDFRFRIEGRDATIGEINAFLSDEVAGCKVVEGKIKCAPTKESGITTIFLNLD